MKNFTNEPYTAQYILEQSLWFNSCITINNNVYIGELVEKTGISHISDIINKSNGHLLSHNELKQVYNIKQTILNHYNYN